MLEYMLTQTHMPSSVMYQSADLEGDMKPPYYSGPSPPAAFKPPGMTQTLSCTHMDLWSQDR